MTANRYARYHPGRVTYYAGGAQIRPRRPAPRSVDWLSLVTAAVLVAGFCAGMTVIAAALLAR